MEFVKEFLRSVKTLEWFLGVFFDLFVAFSFNKKLKASLSRSFEVFD